MRNSQQIITHALRDSWVKNWEKMNSRSQHYVPFIRTQDIKSDGAKNRTPDYELRGQDRDLLSLNEHFFFLHLLHDPRITWIKEQYPLLPIERAMAIASELGLRYPTYPYSANVPVVMTTDFICGTIFGRSVAYSIKDEKALNGLDSLTKRKRENFEAKQKIEKIFWQSDNVDWYLISSASLKTNYSRNLEKLAKYIHLDLRLEFLLPSWLACFARDICQVRQLNCADFLRGMADQLELAYTDVTTMFHHSLWHNFIKANLNEMLFLERSIEDFHFEVVTDDRR